MAAFELDLFLDVLDVFQLCGGCFEGLGAGVEASEEGEVGTATQHQEQFSL